MQLVSKNTFKRGNKKIIELKLREDYSEYTITHVPAEDYYGGVIKKGQNYENLHPALARVYFADFA